MAQAQMSDPAAQGSKKECRANRGGAAALFLTWCQNSNKVSIRLRWSHTELQTRLGSLDISSYKVQGEGETHTPPFHGQSVTGFGDTF